jgi:hypothetical protein
VFYRTPEPNSTTVAEVEMILQQKGIEVTQLMKWTADHCPVVETFAYLYLLVRETSPNLSIQVSSNILGK